MKNCLRDGIRSVRPLFPLIAIGGVLLSILPIWNQQAQSQQIMTQSVIQDSFSNVPRPDLSDILDPLNEENGQTEYSEQAEFLRKNSSNSSKSAVFVDAPVQQIFMRLHTQDPARGYLEPYGAWTGRKLSDQPDQIELIFDLDPSLSAERQFLLTLALPQEVRAVGKAQIASESNCTSTHPTLQAWKTASGSGSYLLTLSKLDPISSTHSDADLGTAKFSLCRLVIKQGVAVAINAEGSSENAIIRLTDLTERHVYAKTSLKIPIHIPHPVFKASTLTPILSPGDAAIWAISLANQGMGGMIGSRISLTKLGTSLALGEIRQILSTEKIPVDLDPRSGHIDIPYLRPGGRLEFQIEASSLMPETELGLCGTSDAQFTLIWPAGTQKTVQTDIQLWVDEPDLRLLSPVPDIIAGTKKLRLRNVGLGEAHSVAIDIYWHNKVKITLKDRDWSYESHENGGRFIYHGGFIPAGEERSLHYDIAMVEQDTLLVLGSAKGQHRLTGWRTAYRNRCGLVRHGPMQRLVSNGQTSNFAKLEIVPVSDLEPDSPDLELLSRERPAQKGEMVIGKSGDYQLILSVMDLEQLPGTGVEIRELIPDLDVKAQSGPFGTVRPLRAVQQPELPGATIRCSGTCQGGDVLVWYIPKTALLTLPKQADGTRKARLSVVLETMPNACMGGLEYSQNAAVRLLDVRKDLLKGEEVPKPVHAYQTRRLENGNIGPQALRQSYNITEIDPEIREVEAEYYFPRNMIGLWNMTRFSDDFGGTDFIAHPELIAGSLYVSLDDGKPITLPVDVVRDGKGDFCDPNQPGSCQGGISVAFGFLSADTGSERITGAPATDRRLTLRYRLKIPAGENNFYSQFAQRAELDLAAPAAAGGCHSRAPGRTVFVQSASPRKSSLPLELTVPSEIGMCKSFPIQLSIGMPQTLLEAGLRFSTSSDLVLRFDPAGALGEGSLENLEISETGLMAKTARLVAQKGRLTIPARIVPSVDQPMVSEDKNNLLAVDLVAKQENGQPFAAITEVTLPVIRSFKPTLTIAPAFLALKQGSVLQWQVAVGNIGDAIGESVQLSINVPPGLQMTQEDQATMNRLNRRVFGGVSVQWQAVSSDGSGMLRWVLPKISAGALETIQIQLSARDTEDQNYIKSALSQQDFLVTGQIGIDCGGSSSVILAETSGPIITPLPAGLSVVHLLDESRCALCQGGLVTLLIRNTGMAVLRNISLEEDLGTSRTGLGFEPGSVVVSTDGGQNYRPLGVSGDPEWRGGILRWTTKQIPELAMLSPTTKAEIRVRFAMTASEESSFSILTPPSHSLIARAVAIQGSGVLTEATPHRIQLPIAQPALNFNLTGRNVTQDSRRQEHIYAGQGDVIEWRLHLRNDGDREAEHIKLSDLPVGHYGPLRVKNYSVPAESVLDTEIRIGEPIPRELSALLAGQEMTLIFEEKIEKPCRATQDQTDTEERQKTRTAFDPGVSFGCKTLIGSSPDQFAAYHVGAPIILDIKPRLGSLRHDFTPMINGGGRITLSVTNHGGTAAALILTNTLPKGLIFDREAGIDVTVTGNDYYQTPAAIVTAHMRGKITAPEIYFDRHQMGDAAGQLRHGETMIVGFDVLQIEVEKTNIQFQDKYGPHRVGLAYDSTCKGEADAVGIIASFDFKTPKILFGQAEIDNLVLTPHKRTNIDLPLYNKGDVGSVADQIGVMVAADRGLHVHEVKILDAVDKDMGLCAVHKEQDGQKAICRSDQIGTLKSDTRFARRLRLTVEALDNDFPLALRVRFIQSEQNKRLSEQVTPKIGRSFSEQNHVNRLFFDPDPVRLPLVGMVVEKQLTIQETSLSDDNIALENQKMAVQVNRHQTNIVLNERTAWSYRLRWFGLDADERVRDIILTDRFPSAHLTFLGIIARPQTPVQILKMPDLPLNFGIDGFSFASEQQEPYRDFLVLTLDEITASKEGFAFTVETQAVGQAGIKLPDQLGVRFVLELAEANKLLRQPIGLGTIFGDERLLEAITADSLHADALHKDIPSPPLSRLSAIESQKSDPAAIRKLVLAPIKQTPLPAPLLIQILGPVVHPEIILGDMGKNCGGGEFVPTHRRQAGDHLAIAVKLANALGAETAYDLVTELSIPPGLRILQLDPEDQNAPMLNPLSVSIKNLAPGEALTRYFCVNVTDDVAMGDQFSITALTSVAAHPNTSEQAERVRTTIVAKLDILAKTAPEQKIQAIEYNIAQKSMPTRAIDTIIGERHRLQLQVPLPASRITDLTLVQILDAGLTYVPNTSALTLGSRISECSKLQDKNFEPKREALPEGRWRLSWPLGRCVVRAADNFRDQSADALRSLDVGLDFTTILADLETIQHGTQLETAASVVYQLQTGEMKQIDVKPIRFRVREPVMRAEIGMSLGKEKSKVVDFNNLISGDIIGITLNLINLETAPSLSADSEASIPTSTAHMTPIRLALPEGLDYVEGSSHGVGFAAPRREEGYLVWDNRNFDIDVDLESGTQRSLTLSLIVTEAVRPVTKMVVPITVSWTSIPDRSNVNLSKHKIEKGAVFGNSSILLHSDRNNRTYRTGSEIVLTTRDTAAFYKEIEHPFSIKENKSFRIGDLVTFILKVKLQPGRYDGLKLIDYLPEGFVFYDTLEIISESHLNDLDYILTEAPESVSQNSQISKGVSDPLIWQFKKLRLAKQDRSGETVLTLRYRARIADRSDIFPTDPDARTKMIQLAGKKARLEYPTGSDTEAGNSRQLQSDAPPDITLSQPLLTTKLIRNTKPTFGENGYDIGKSINFSATIDNIGTASAHRVGITATLDPGLREINPTLFEINMILLDGRAISFQRGRDFTVSFNQKKGLLTLALTDAPDAYIAPGEILGVSFSLALGQKFGAGEQTKAEFQLVDYYSVPSASAGRYYPAETKKSFAFRAPIPKKELEQEVEIIGQPELGNQAPIGAEIGFTVKVPMQPVRASLYDVTIERFLPEGMRLIAVETNSADLSNADEIYVSGAKPRIRTLETNFLVQPYQSVDGVEIHIPRSRPERIALGMESKAQKITVGFSHLRPGEQGEVRVIASLANTENNMTGSTFRSPVRYRWSSRPGGDVSEWGETSLSAAIQLIEPEIAATKSAQSVGDLDAGDLITYTVRIDNTGSKLKAYDLIIHDELPPEVTFVPESTRFIASRKLASPLIEQDNQGQQKLIWKVENGGIDDLDLDPGETIEFTYKAKLNDGIRPYRSLISNLHVYWTGMDGNNPYERTGSGQPPWNNYSIVSHSETIPMIGGEIVKKIPLGPFSNGSWRIGDQVEITLPIQLSEGTFGNLVVEDLLPPGLIFEEMLPILTSLDFLSSMDISAPQIIARPDGAAGSVLRWLIGPFVNPGDNTKNDFLTLRYRVRIANDMDVIPPPLARTITEMISTPQFSFDNPASEQRVIYRGKQALLRVGQPRLVLEKSIDTQATPPNKVPFEYNGGSRIRYRLIVHNKGSTPAYDVVVQDNIPKPLRARLPELIQERIQLSDQVIDPAFDNTQFHKDGFLTWSLTDETAILPGKKFEIVYDVWLDREVLSGALLKDTPRILSYRSLPRLLSGEQKYKGRNYLPVIGTESPFRTPSPQDIEIIMATAPELFAGATVSALSKPIQANIGDIVYYTVTAPLTPIQAVLRDLVIEDRLPETLMVENVTARILGTENSDRPPPEIVTLGQDVRVVFPYLPRDTRARIQIAARIVNKPNLIALARNIEGQKNKDEAQERALIINDTIRYHWSRYNGAGVLLTEDGVQPPKIAQPSGAFLLPTPLPGPGLYAAPAVVQVTEPLLQVKAQRLGKASPGQAGDVEIIRLTIHNQGDGPARDLRLKFDLPTGLALQGLNTKEGEPELGLANLNAGDSSQIDLPLILTRAAQPQQQLQAKARLTWSSVAAEDNGKNKGRDGSLTPIHNDYRHEIILPTLKVQNPVFVVTAQMSSNSTEMIVDPVVSMQKIQLKTVPDPIPISVGALMSYKMHIQAPEATIRQIRLTHQLDPALQIQEAFLSVSNMTRTDGKPLQTRLSPKQKDGDQFVSLDIGDLRAVGKNPSFTVTLRAWVKNNTQIQTGTKLPITSRLSFAHPAAQTKMQTTRSIIIPNGPEPVLTIVEPGPFEIKQQILENITPPRAEDGLFHADDTVRMQIDIINKGESPAYSLVLLQNLPPGLRKTTPVLVQALFPETNQAVTLTRDLTQFSDEGTLLWHFERPEEIIAPGKVLRLIMDVKIDVDVGAGLDLPVQTGIAIFSSAAPPGPEEKRAESDDVRHYAGTELAVLKLRTPNPSQIVAVQHVQPNQTNPSEEDIPIDRILKSNADVSRNGTFEPVFANIGQKITRYLVFPQTPLAANLYDVSLQTWMPEGVRVEHVSIQSPVEFGVPVDQARQLFNKNKKRSPSDPINRVQIEIPRIPANRQLVLRLDGVITSDPITQTAARQENISLRWASEPGGEQHPPLLLSTSHAPIIRTRPDLRMRLDLVNKSDDPLQQGDLLFYQLEIENIGDGLAHEVVLSLNTSEVLTLASLRPTEGGEGRLLRQKTDPNNSPYRWFLERPLLAKERRNFEISFQVSDKVQPFEKLKIVPTLNWTNASGMDGQVATLQGLEQTVRAAGLVFDMVPEETGRARRAYQIGEIIAYRAMLTVPKLQIQDLVFRFHPDMGLKFVSATPILEPLAVHPETDSGASVVSEFVVREEGLSGKASKRDLMIKMGDITSKPFPARLGVRILMQVGNQPKNQSGSVLSLASQVSFINPNASAPNGKDGRYGLSAKSVAVSVNEPSVQVVGFQRVTPSSLPSTSDGVSYYRAGEEIEYQIILRNDSKMPAYETELILNLPKAMHNRLPQLIRSQLTGIKINDPEQIHTKSSEIIQTDEAGQFMLTLPNGSVIPPEGLLTLELRLAIDLQAAAGLLLRPALAAVHWYSQPDAENRDRRYYERKIEMADQLATVMPGPPSTPQYLDNANTPSQNQADRGIAVGERFHYSLFVPAAPIAATLYDVAFYETLPKGIEIEQIQVSLVDLKGRISPFETAQIRLKGSERKLTLAQIPANHIAKITLTAEITNIPEMQEDTVIVSNPRYGWAQAPGGPEKTRLAPIARAPPLLLKEAKIALELERLPPTIEVQAGDSAQMQIHLVNHGTGIAHEVELDLILDPTLILDIVEADPAVDTQITTIGKPQKIESIAESVRWRVSIGRLVSGAEITVLTRLRVSDSVQPRQTMVMEAQAKWRSTERLNEYTQIGSTSLSVDKDNMRPSKVQLSTGLGHEIFVTAYGDSLPVEAPQEGGGFRIGDLVEYRIRIELPEATINDVTLQDALPPGFIFVETLPLQTPNPAMVFTEPTGAEVPQEGAEGVLSWRIGQVLNPGDNNPDNNSLILVYRVRISTDEALFPPDPSDIEIVNSAQLSYQDAAGEKITSVRASTSILIRQPSLDLTLVGPNSSLLIQDKMGSFEIQIANKGTGPAYGLKTKVWLPSGMSQRDLVQYPVDLVYQKDNSAAPIRFLQKGRDYSLSYEKISAMDPDSDLVSGLLQIDLAPEQKLPPEQSLYIRFQAGFNDAGLDGNRGLILAGLTSYNRREASESVAATIRNQIPEFDPEALNTPAWLVGVNWVDAVVMQLSAPILTFVKKVIDPNGGSVEPGDHLTYRIEITNRGTAPALNATLTDLLDPVFDFATLRDITITPRQGILDRTKPDKLTVSDMIIPAMRLQQDGPQPGRQVISYSITLPPVLPHGSHVGKKAELIIQGQKRRMVSNENMISDQDPAIVTLRARPRVDFTASATTLQNQNLQPGGLLIINLRAVNKGSEPMAAARLSMPMPPLASYVPGSLSLNGKKLPETRYGTNPFAESGLLVQSKGAEAGQLEVGEEMLLRFIMRADENTMSGARLAGQAWLSGSGIGSGPIMPVRSDDPTTPMAGDPWQRVIGGGPVLLGSLALKRVPVGTSDDPKPASDHQRIRANLILVNSGDQTATGLKIKLPIPNWLALVPGSIKYDPDQIGPMAPRSVASLPGQVFLSLGDISAGKAAEISLLLAAGPQALNQLSLQAFATANNHRMIASSPDYGSQRVSAPTRLTLSGTAPALTLVQDVESDARGNLDAGQSLIYTLELFNAPTAGGEARDIRLLDEALLLHQDGTARTLPILPGSIHINGIQAHDTTLAQGLLLDNLRVGLGILRPGDRRIIRYRYRLPQVSSVPFKIGDTIRAQAMLSANDGTVNEIAQTSRGSFQSENEPVIAQVGGVVGLGPGHGHIGGDLFVDRDGDGVRSTDEARLAGWGVDLLHHNTPRATTVTDREGRFSFSNIPSDDNYTLLFRHPETGVGFVALSPQGVLEQPGQIRAGEVILLDGVPLMSSGSVYDSVSRRPVPGAKLTLLYNDLPVPAASLMAGQQGQVTGTDGLYRFILRGSLPRANAVNYYRLRVQSPEGYTRNFPAGLVLPEPFPYTGKSNKGKVTPDAINFHLFPQSKGPSPAYFIDLILNPGDRPVVNNHIPLDPLAGAQVELRKSISPEVVRVGETVAVKLRATNLTGTPIRWALSERMPPQFTYIPGTARLAGQPREPTVIDGILTWDNLLFPADRPLDISFRLRSIGSAEDGSHPSSSLVIDVESGVRLSNRAIGLLRIAGGNVPICSIVSGLVFENRDTRLKPESYDPGLAGIRIIGPNGLVAVTDRLGQFSFNCATLAAKAKGGTVTLTLDESSLPANFNLLGPNPHRVPISGIKQGSVEFPVTRKRVVRLDLADGAFQSGQLQMKTRWRDSLDALMKLLREEPSSLRLTYRLGKEPSALVEKRIAFVHELLLELWRQDHGGYRLKIDQHLLTEFSLNKMDG